MCRLIYGVNLFEGSHRVLVLLLTRLFQSELVYCNLWFVSGECCSLHYTIAMLETPVMKFLVALDTEGVIYSGFPATVWNVHLQMIRLIVLIWANHIHVPGGSSTSQNETCTERSSNNCPYHVLSYVSYETSTSGILVEDILHLRKDIRKWCRVHQGICIIWVQTGSFWMLLLQMVYLVQFWRKYQFLVSCRGKVMYQILSPCVLG